MQIKERMHIQHGHLFLTIAILLIAMYAITAIEVDKEVINSIDVNESPIPEHCYLSYPFEVDINCDWARVVPLFAMLAFPIGALFLILYWMGMRR